MNGPQTYDAVIVGSGPNGLAAAVELARNGHSVAVLEGRSIIGVGMRSAEITLPGFVHDLGSAIHPLGYASPFFRSLPLDEHGLEWVHPDVPLAHPLDGGEAGSRRGRLPPPDGTRLRRRQQYSRLLRGQAEPDPAPPRAGVFGYQGPRRRRRSGQKRLRGRA